MELKIKSALKTRKVLKFEHDLSEIIPKFHFHYLKGKAAVFTGYDS